MKQVGAAVVEIALVEADHGNSWGLDLEHRPDRARGLAIPVELTLDEGGAGAASGGFGDRHAAVHPEAAGAV